MGESDEGMNSMILIRDLLTALGLDLKFSERIAIGGAGPYDG